LGKNRLRQAAGDNLKNLHFTDKIARGGTGKKTGLTAEKTTGRKKREDRVAWVSAQKDYGGC